MVRVLLADDHPQVRQIVSSLLEPEFNIVGSVCDGQALIEAAAKLCPDLIVTDISMPVLNGLEAAEHIRRSGCTALIVFLTVHTESDFVDACFAAGGVAHVSKVSMVADLLPAIHTALQKTHH